MCPYLVFHESCFRKDSHPFDGWLSLTLVITRAFILPFTRQTANFSHFIIIIFRNVS